MTENPEGAKSSTHDLFFEQASAKLKLQWEWGNDLDTKAGLLIGFAGVILATAAGSETAGSYLHLVVVVALFAVIIFGLMAYRLTTYEIPPDIGKLWEKYYGHEESEVKGILTANLVEATAKNRVRLEEKVNWSKRSFFMLFIGVAIFAVEQVVAVLK